METQVIEMKGYYVAGALDWAGKMEIHHLAFKTVEEAQAKADEMREVSKKCGINNSSTIYREIFQKGAKVIDLNYPDDEPLTIKSRGATCSDEKGFYQMIWLEGRAFPRESLSLVVIPE